MAAIAANIERIQQQMQSELEKFKAIQKGNLQEMWHSKIFCVVSSKAHSSEHFCKTGNKLLVLAGMGSVCFQFYDKFNLLTDTETFIKTQRLLVSHTDSNSLSFCHA